MKTSLIALNLKTTEFQFFSSIFLNINNIYIFCKEKKFETIS